MKEGWELKKLGEVCRFINGRAYSKNELLESGKYPVLRVGNFFTNNHWYYSDLELDEEKYCDNGDLLYAWSASFGPRIWTGSKMIYHYHIWKVIPNKDSITKEFLFQLLEWDIEAIKSAHGTGTTMIHVGKGSIENRILPIPPLPEQQHIVSLLDQTFAAINKAKENAQRNLQNAKELFESYLQGVFEKKGEGWEEKTVESLVNEGLLFKPLDGNHGEIHPHSKDYVSAGIPFIMACDMKDGNVDQENCKFIHEKQAKSLRTGFAIDGDVLLSHKGTIGRVATLKTKNEYVVLTPQVTFYRIKDKSRIMNRFIHYYFLTQSFQKELNDIAKGGSTRAYIGITRQLSLKLLIAPLSEQQSIVSRLDALSAETKRLEAIYQQKLLALEELKKSVLEKAFKGEL